MYIDVLHFMVCYIYGYVYIAPRVIPHGAYIYIYMDIYMDTCTHNEK